MDDSTTLCITITLISAMCVLFSIFAMRLDTNIKESSEYNHTNIKASSNAVDRNIPNIEKPFNIPNIDKTTKPKTIKSDKWQIKVISFSNHHSLISNFHSFFPNVDATIQNAVDLRKIPEDKLFENNLISMHAYLTMTEGRKWDREVNSKGAVGLAQANRIALLDSNNSDKSILLCEDDCMISNPHQFVNEINQLLNNTSLFDVAVFGVRLIKESESQIDPVPFMPDGWYYLGTNSHFWFTHCVLYTPKGRKIVGEYLKYEKLEMQIDSLYSYMNKLKSIRVIVQVSNISAKQKSHASSIQTDYCPICEMKPNESKRLQINKKLQINNDGDYNLTIIGIIVTVLVLICCAKHFGT